MGQISFFHLSFSIVCFALALVLTLLHFGRKLFDSSDEEVTQLRENPIIWFFYRSSLITWVFFRRIGLHANYYFAIVTANYFPALSNKIAQRKYAKLSEDAMAVELRATAHVYILLLADLNAMRSEMDAESVQFAETSLKDLKAEYFRKKAVFNNTYPGSTEDQGHIPD